MPKISIQKFVFALYACMFATYLILHYFWDVLSQPYLWDELGVYSRAASRMYQDGLSLLPNAIPDELSRGHPLLSTFYFALAFKLFGCHPFVAHCAAALINMVNFHLIFLILKRYISPFYALVFTLILFIQPVFLSQSVLVLPETPLMLATSLAIFAYLENKKILLCFAITSALFIKESAVILPIAFVLAEFIKNKFKLKFSFIAYAFIAPVLCIATFFVLQKIQRGYYFYPLHTSLAKFEAYYIHERWDNLSAFIFSDQGHFLFPIILIISIIIGSKYLKNIDRSLLILPILFIGGIGFQILNYYLSRYTLFFLLPYFIFCLLLFALSSQDKKYLIWMSVIVLVINGLWFLKGRGAYTDVNFSYVPHLKNMTAVIAELDKPEYQKKSVEMGFPLAACYFDQNNGYERNADFKIELVPSDSVDFKVLTLPGNIADTSYLKPNFRLYKTVKTGPAYSLIYKNITP